MLKRIGVLVAAGALCLMWVLADSAQAQCVVDTSTPTYANGQFLRYNPCDANGNVKVTGGGGGGDASAANQVTQTGLLTTIDADTGTIAGAVKAEDAAHSSGHTGIPFWGVRNDSAATSLTDTNGDYTPIATDSNGRLFINAISSIFSVTPGTTTTALGKAEDAAHVSGDTGVAVLTKRTDTAASSAGTDGDYATLNSDADGKLWTNADTEMPAAGALADSTSNPTVPAVGVFPHSWNGSTWDRAKTATAGAGNVDSTTQRVVLSNNSFPCTSYAAISQTADTAVITATASQYAYICSIVIVAGAAEVVSIWEGTGTACGTGSAAILGSTTEANGLSFAANGGFTVASGIPILRTASTNVDVCVRQSGANRVSGFITYTKAP